MWNKAICFPVVMVRSLTVFVMEYHHSKLTQVQVLTVADAARHHYCMVT
jgi:hypothetical protein